ncbi:ABC transporter substrate-binding protein [Lachnoclostridium edouardi]|uniref:ABC transporter substrate-binding protein n=1 Tax=Lachnoclostridium edouardi TaxID=1926283 RepID=UPI000C7C4697|nr:ABC transporter substrate-binding protein [Lachnoclostridium edouardi]
MKKVWKKLAAAGMAAALGATALTGCSGGGSTNEQPAESGAETTKEPIEITFWHVYSENFGAPVIKEMVEEFNNTHDDIKVKEVYNPDMYPGLMQNLQAEVAAGNPPSICMIGYNYIKYFAANFNYISPQDLVDQYVPEDKDYLSTTFLDNVLSLAQVDGEQIGLPYCISAPILCYNPDLFQQAGLDPEKGPESWAEVQEYAKQITEKTGEYGFYMQEYADNWAVQGLLESNGASMLQDDKAAFATPEGVEAYQILADMVLKDKSALHITADEGIQAFCNGKVGIACISSAKIGTVTQAAQFDVKGAAFPGFEGKEKKLPTGGNFLPITAQTEEEQKAAWEFIKFVMQPEWLAKWTENTGYLPPRQEVKEEEGLKAYIEENQMLKVAFDEMEDLQPWAAYPGDMGTQAEQLLADTRDKILDGSQTPEEALKEAQDTLNKMLEEQ